MDELLRNIILVFMGWSLGILTTSVDNWRKSRHEYRILFGRCYRITEELAINLAVSEEWTKLGGFRSITQLFDDSNKAGLPPSPPHLPDDFSDVLNRLFEYEATHPKSKLGKQFITMQNWVNILIQVYAGLEVALETSSANLPERPMLMYKDTWNDLREYLIPIIQELDYQRSSFLVRPFKAIRRKLKKLRESKTQKTKG